MSFNKWGRDFMPTFGKILLKRVRETLRDPENRKKFEEWYLQKYGEPYVWKTGLEDDEECSDSSCQPSAHCC